MDKYNFMHVFKSDINTVCVCIWFTAATKSHFCHSSSGDKINCFLQQRWHWKYWYDFPFPWVLTHWQTTAQDQSCSNRCLRTVRMRLQKNAEKSIESDRSTEQQVDSLLFHPFLFFLPSMHYMLVFYFVVPPPHPFPPPPASFFSCRSREEDLPEAPRFNHDPTVIVFEVSAPCQYTHPPEMC